MRLVGSIRYWRERSRGMEFVGERLDSTRRSRPRTAAFGRPLTELLGSIQLKLDGRYGFCIERCDAGKGLRLLGSELLIKLITSTEVVNCVLAAFECLDIEIGNKYSR